MESDDLTFDLVKKELDRVRRLYVQEQEKNRELEKRLSEQQKDFSDQYDSITEMQNALSSEGGPVESLDQEKIKVMSRHLAREHKMRFDAIDGLDKVKKEGELRLADERTEREVFLADKDREIESLKDELAQKDELIRKEREKSNVYEERELNTLLDVMVSPQKELIGGEETTWVTETQDLIKVLHRWGSIKLDEASQTMDLDGETVRSYAKILLDKGLIKSDDFDSPNPTLRATRDLVGKLNDLTIKKRRRGRFQ
ncbi:MAG: hypothetical protein ABH851_00410 [Methanobacteriota archaeon]